MIKPINLIQFVKQFDGIFVIFDSISTTFKLIQFAKHPIPKIFTLSGILTLNKFWFENDN